MKKVIFLDRDGTIIDEPVTDKQVDSLAKLSFIPGAIGALSRIAKELDFALVLVTNQDGLGTASFPEETFWPAQEKMLQTLAGEGVVFENILIDRTFEADRAATRKPGTGLLGDYLDGSCDLANSYVIGDRLTDLELAKNLTARGIYFSSENSELAEFFSNDWAQIEQFFCRPKRIASVQRNTAETKIEISLDLDGSGVSSISTGIGFFDHMLEQLAKHGKFDLKIAVAGDLQIDEHHTIEDTAIALGEVFDRALGDKRGIERYAFLLPMDEALAQVALDLSGRSYLVWQAEFEREMIGEMPTEMFRHFFKSFSDSARCTLNIKAEGENEHHKIEAIFKGFAVVLRNAVKRSETGLQQIPSTKGVL